MVKFSANIISVAVRLRHVKKNCVYNNYYLVMYLFVKG